MYELNACHINWERGNEGSTIQDSGQGSRNIGMTNWRGGFPLRLERRRRVCSLDAGNMAKISLL